MQTNLVGHRREQSLLGHYRDKTEYFSYVEQNFDQIVAKLRLDLPGRTILDVGCGTGYFCRVVRSRFGAIPLGVDFCEERIAIARERDPDGHYIVSDGYQSVAMCPDVDYVTFWDVLEHLEEPKSIIDMARQRGTVVASIPLDNVYVTHLQVWDLEQVKKELQPDVIVPMQFYLLCKWRKQS